MEHQHQNQPVVPKINPDIARLEAGGGGVMWSTRAQAASTTRGAFTRIKTITRENFNFVDKRQAFEASKLKVLKSFKGPSRGVELTTRVIKTLLRPGEWMPHSRNRYFLSAEELLKLIDDAMYVFSLEPTLLRLKSPMKIFGDIHGQFDDLMRLFEEYGMPVIAGDLVLTDYLFLGDYVDRGAWNLEVITLLFALKVHYPEHIFLIRGNHEISEINKVYGFYEECVERLGPRDGHRVWERANELFQYLPLAAAIDDKILCMHGGIGDAVSTMQQIDDLERPLPASFWADTPERPIVNALLWSDPTSDETRPGFEPSDRGGDLKLFGPDILDRFCQANGLDMVVRAHQCVMDGFERFARGKLVTVFSATNYCGSEENAGAILQIGRGLVVVPKVIFPTEQDSEMWNNRVNSSYPPSPARNSAAGPGVAEEPEEEEEEEEDEDDEMADDDAEAQKQVAAQQRAAAAAQAQAAAQRPGGPASSQQGIQSQSSEKEKGFMSFMGGLFNKGQQPGGSGTTPRGSMQGSQPAQQGGQPRASSPIPGAGPGLKKR